MLGSGLLGSFFQRTSRQRLEFGGSDGTRTRDLVHDRHAFQLEWSSLCDRKGELSR